MPGGMDHTLFNFILAHVEHALYVLLREHLGVLSVFLLKLLADIHVEFLLEGRFLFTAHAGALDRLVAAIAGRFGRLFCYRRPKTAGRARTCLCHGSCFWKGHGPGCVAEGEIRPLALPSKPLDKFAAFSLQICQIRTLDKLVTTFGTFTETSLNVPKCPQNVPKCP